MRSLNVKKNWRYKFCKFYELNFLKFVKRLYLTNIYLYTCCISMCESTGKERPMGLPLELQRERERDDRRVSWGQENEAHSKCKRAMPHYFA